MTPVELGAMATAGLGGFTVFLNNIKGFFARLESFLIVKAEIDGYCAEDFLDYCWSHFKASPVGIRKFSSENRFIRPKNRFGRVVSEITGSFITFWKGWRPIFISINGDKNKNNTGDKTISFIRGTFDLEKLMIDSSVFCDTNKHEKTGHLSRYHVKRCFGRKRNSENQEEMSVSGQPLKSEDTGEGGYRPLYYTKDELGIPTSDRPMDNLAYEESVQEFYKEVCRWKESKDWFKEKGLSWRFGAGLFGPPGCHAAGTEILMFDGTVKKVEDVLVGDLLMGPDSKPRKVLELARGIEPLIKTIPTKGEPFITNINHMFHLTPSGKNQTVNCPINISGYDLMFNVSRIFADRLKITRTGVDFEEGDLEIDPYILGLWLGDGHSSSVALTNIDSEIIRAWTIFAEKLNLKIRQYGISYYLANDRKIIRSELNSNPATKIFREMNIINNKHIPHKYKASSRKQRLELLAGLIDSDGHRDGNNGYEIIQKNDILANDILFLARSLGYGAYLSKKVAKCQTGAVGVYNRIYLSGSGSEIPCRVPRKRGLDRKQIKEVLRTGFTIEPYGIGEYYGFCLDKDHLYLTGDFTIHHNTGKSSLAKAIGQGLDMPIHSYDLTTMDNEELVDNWQLSLGESPCIVLLEDIDRIFDENKQIKTDKNGAPLTLDCLLNCISGVQPSDGILVLVTANDVSKLDPALGVPDGTGKSTRPGRLDRAVYIGALNKEGRYKIAKRILADCPDLIEETVLSAEGETGAQFESRCSKLALERYWGKFKVYGEIRHKIELEQY